MHPALQRRRRHLMMTRRTTRRGSRRRGLATFLLVTLGVFGMMFVGSIMGTAGGMYAAYAYFASAPAFEQIAFDSEAGLLEIQVALAIRPPVEAP